MLKNDPENPENYVLLWKLYEQKDITKTIENYQLAIEKWSINQKVYLYLSSHYSNNWQFGEQIKILELALNNISSKTLNTVIYLYLAEAYLETWNKEKAIKVYEEALWKDYRVVEPLAYLYYSYEQDLEKARTFFLENKRIDNWENFTDFEYQKQLSIFYSILLRKTLKERAQQFENKYQTGQNYNPIKITPEFLENNPDIALLHSEITKAFEQICQNMESRLYHYRKLAELFIQQGKLELALNTFQTAALKFKNNKAALKFKNNKYEYKKILSNISRLLLVQWNIDRAIEIVTENNEILSWVLYSFEQNDADIIIPQETIMTFYDKLLRKATDSSTHFSYLYYLKENNKLEKIQEIVKDGIKKFPKEKGNFELYLKN